MNEDPLAKVGTSTSDGVYCVDAEARGDVDKTSATFFEEQSECTPLRDPS